MMIGDAISVLWETDRGLTATQAFLDAVAQAVPEVRARAPLLHRMGELLEAQHAASFTAGLAEQILTVPSPVRPAPPEGAP